MTSEKWRQVNQICGAAFDLAPELRPAFLVEACKGDSDVLRQVENLLASFDSQFLEQPAIDKALAQIINRQLVVGQIISHYNVQEKIGAGGMGEVYRARDTLLDRPVALKVLLPEFCFNADRVRRFQLEARAASALNHPNILTIHEIGASDDSHFIASEFVRGETLRDRLKGESLSLDETLDIGVQIASALQVAHASGIVHRDIKPENVMIRDDGLIKVLDFGLAKLSEPRAFAGESVVDAEAETRAQVKTQSGIILGTAAYMSPEQARGKMVDARTDIFSFAVVLYEMLAGKMPFVGETTSDVIAAILKSEPAPLSRFDVPKDLAHIVEKTLRKSADERYQHVNDLLIDLRDFKQDAEFEAKLERSAAPSKTEEATANKSATFTEIQNARTTSGAEYIAGEIRNQKLGFGIVSVLILAAVGLGYWFFVSRSIHRIPIESIALLPFENGSSDANLGYLSDGLSEGLIDRLSQLPQLKVVARNSSFKYRGQNLDLQQVANALGVQTIVTGRVEQRADNLVIRTELIDVRENRQLWSDSYNRRTTDLQSVQGEIAQTVSEKLRLRLTGEQEQQLAKTSTANPEAYQLYLTGLFAAKTSLKKSLDYFAQATQLDPNFALAFYRVRWCYFYLGANSLLDPKESTPKARTALQRALELDGTMAEAHQLLGEIKNSEWDWTGAENEFNRAIELNPNTAIAHQLNARRLAKAGRIEEAAAESRLYQALDPLEIPPKIHEGVIYLHSRRFDDAIAKFEQIVKLAPDSALAHVWLGYAYAGKGMYREAITEYQQTDRIEGQSTSNDCYMGFALAKYGKRSEALALLNKVKTTKEYVSPFELAALYTGLGDTEGAFQALERAYAVHDLQLKDLLNDSAYDELHNDPRFQDLVLRVGLSQ